VATATTGSTTVAYDYDDAGRRTEQATDVSSTPTETRTYSYDAAGKAALVEVSTVGQPDLSLGFHVDGNGQRYGIDLDNGYDTFTWVLPWDTTRPIPAALGSEVNGVLYLRSEIGNRNLSYNLFGTVQWYKYDARGSTIKPDNNLTAAQEPPTSYDPYGAPTGNDGPGTFYRGELYFDTLHLRNRDYDPTTGQFTTQDPIDGQPGTPDETNPYDYVGNDPHNHTDPLGLCRMKDGNFVYQDLKDLCQNIRAHTTISGGCEIEGTLRVYAWDPFTQISWGDDGSCHAVRNDGTKIGVSSWEGACDIGGARQNIADFAGGTFSVLSFGSAQHLAGFRDKTCGSSAFYTAGNVSGLLVLAAGGPLVGSAGEAGPAIASPSVTGIAEILSYYSTASTGNSVLHEYFGNNKSFSNCTTMQTITSASYYYIYSKVPAHLRVLVNVQALLGAAAVNQNCGRLNSD
jgi:RHS repeat-associated protein